MKIVVLDRDTLGDDIDLSEFSKFGEVIVYGSTGREEVFSRVSDADVLVLNKVRIDEDVFATANILKLICITATGFDNVDINAAKRHGVAVCNVPAYSTDSVCLFTVSMVLTLLTNMNTYSSYVKSGEYTLSGIPNRIKPVYHELRGRTWGIVGYGNIGRAVAEVAKAFGAKVLVYKRTKVQGVNCVDIETLLMESDVITLHCPLNEDSRHLINSERIQLMKKDVVIVNAARGAVVNDEDIASAILNGDIGAYGSDVYTTEPLSIDNPIYKIRNMENVLLTPHSAWGAYEARERCISVCCDNIRDFIDGKALNRVDILGQK